LADDGKPPQISVARISLVVPAISVIPAILSLSKGGIARLVDGTFGQEASGPGFRRDDGT
jgi:hypothetical protein